MGETDIRPVDGNPITFPTCKVTVRWDGEVFEVEAIEIDNDGSFPIVGMQLCQDRKITIEMRINGEALVERMLRLCLIDRNLQHITESLR